MKSDQVRWTQPLDFLITPPRILRDLRGRICLKGHFLAHIRHFSSANFLNFKCLLNNIFSKIFE